MTVPSSLLAHPSGVAVAEYVDTRLCDHEKVHAAERLAVQVASEAMAARLEGVNEFRGQLSDQVATFVRRDLMDAHFTATQSRNDLIHGEFAKKLDALEGQATKSAIIVGVISGTLGLLVGSLIMPVVGHFFSG